MNFSALIPRNKISVNCLCCERDAKAFSKKMLTFHTKGEGVFGKARQVTEKQQGERPSWSTLPVT